MTEMTLMPRLQSPRLWLAIGLSVAAHVSLATWLLSTRATVLTHAKKGVVSVSFVEPVSHRATTEARVNPSRSIKKSEPAELTPPPPAVEATPATSQPTGDPQAVARESDLFISAVTRIIDQHKVYPREALAREEEGKVIVGLTLERSGQVVASQVEEPSPFSRLNEAALQTIKMVGQFPPVPSTIATPLHLHVPLVFKIENN